MSAADIIAGFRQSEGDAAATWKTFIDNGGRAIAPLHNLSIHTLRALNAAHLIAVADPAALIRSSDEETALQCAQSLITFTMQRSLLTLTVHSIVEANAARTAVDAIHKAVATMNDGANEYTMVQARTLNALIATVMNESSAASIAAHNLYSTSLRLELLLARAEVSVWLTARARALLTDMTANTINRIIAQRRLHKRRLHRLSALFKSAMNAAVFQSYDFEANAGLFGDIIRAFLTQDTTASTANYPPSSLTALLSTIYSEAALTVAASAVDVTTYHSAKEWIKAHKQKCNLYLYYLLNEYDQDEQHSSDSNSNRLSLSQSFASAFDIPLPQQRVLSSLHTIDRAYDQTHSDRPSFVSKDSSSKACMAVLLHYNHLVEIEWSLPLLISSFSRRSYDDALSIIDILKPKLHSPFLQVVSLIVYIETAQWHRVASRLNESASSSAVDELSVIFVGECIERTLQTQQILTFLRLSLSPLIDAIIRHYLQRRIASSIDSGSAVLTYVDVFILFELSRKHIASALRVYRQCQQRHQHDRTQKCHIPASIIGAYESLIRGGTAHDIALDDVAESNITTAEMHRVRAVFDRVEFKQQSLMRHGATSDSDGGVAVSDEQTVASPPPPSLSLSVDEPIALSLPLSLPPSGLWQPTPIGYRPMSLDQLVQQPTQQAFTDVTAATHTPLTRSVHDDSDDSGSRSSVIEQVNAHFPVSEQPRPTRGGKRTRLSAATAALTATDTSPPSPAADVSATDSMTDDAQSETDQSDVSATNSPAQRRPRGRPRGSTSAATRSTRTTLDTPNAPVGTYNFRPRNVDQHQTNTPASRPRRGRVSKTKEIQ